MTKEILFLTDNSFSDAIAYTAVCYYGQTTKMPITLVSVGSPNYVSQLRNELQKETDILFLANIVVLNTYLEPYMMDQCNGCFSSVYDVFAKLKMFDQPDVVAAITNLYGSTELHLPSAVAYILFRRFGLIDFSNYVAQKLIEDIRWDIVRDDYVINTIYPKELEDVPVS